MWERANWTKYSREVAKINSAFDEALNLKELTQLINATVIEAARSSITHREKSQGERLTGAGSYRK